MPGRALLPALLLLTTVAACAQPGRSPAASAKEDGSPGGETVVAEVAGAEVTLAEVDRRAASRLQRLRHEEYEVRRQALEEIAAERLLQKEAAARGLSPEALLRAEVLDGLLTPTGAEVAAVYERSRSRLGGRSLEQVRPDIERSLRKQARAAREAAFRQELRGRHGVRIRLEQPRAEVAIPADAPTLGPAGAAVTLVEFLDYQCPYCHRVQEVVDRLLERYQGKLRFVHREFLLGSPRALPAARAARCAGEQGRFWEYHRSLLGAPGDMSDRDLQARAASFALDQGRFAACLASERHDAAIEKAVSEGTELGVSGTPTFFINGRRLVGVRPFEVFQELIDAELGGG